MFNSSWFLVPVLALAAWGAMSMGSPSLQAGELGAWGLHLGAGGRALWVQQVLLGNQPPLSFLFERISPYGETASIWELRLPALLLGSLNVGLLFALGRRLVNPRTALIAALLLALAPAQLWFSSQAGAALLPTAFCLAAVVCLYRLADGIKPSRFGLLFGICCIGLVFSHAHGIAFLFAFSLLARMSRLPGERRVHLFGLLGLLLYVGYRWGLQGGASMALGEPQLGAISVGDWDGMFLEWLASGRALAPLLGSTLEALGAWQTWLALGLKCLLALVLFRGLMNLLHSQHFGQESAGGADERRPVSAHLILLVLALPISLLVASRFGAAASVQPADLLPVLPFFLLLLASGITVRAEAGASSMLALCLGLLIKLDLVFCLLQPGAWMVDEPRVDWRGAGAYLAAELDGDERAREVYVAYDDGYGLLAIESRLQPKDWRQRMAQLSAEVLAKRDSFTAGQASLDAMDALEFAWEDAWEAREMSLLSIESNPLRSTGPSRIERLPFYLLFKQHPGQEFYRLHPLLLPPLLNDPTLAHKPLGDPTLDSQLDTQGLLTLLEQRHFNSLVLLKMGWVK